MLFLMSIVLLIAIYTTAVSGILGLTARFHTKRVQSLWKLADLLATFNDSFYKVRFFYFDCRFISNVWNHQFIFSNSRSIVSISKSLQKFVENCYNRLKLSRMQIMLR